MSLNQQMKRYRLALDTLHLWAIPAELRERFQCARLHAERKFPFERAAMRAEIRAKRKERKELGL